MKKHTSRTTTNAIQKRLASFLILAVMLFCSFISVFPSMAVTVEATSFTPRLTAPASNNSYYVHTSYGGLNSCILGSNQSSYRGCVLPNCVGYAWGRAYEMTGKKPTLSQNNATTFWGRTSDGYKRGQTAQLGAIMCWSGGSSGAGHVAVVEAISGSKITISESSWSGTYFRTRTGTIQELTSWLGYSFKFQGFIYILDNAGSVNPPVQPTQRSYTIQSSSGANVRSSASTSAQIVGAISKSSVVYYTQTKSANGYTWMLIESGSFKSGSWGKIIGYWVAMV